jgi:hypothetical protein
MNRIQGVGYILGNNLEDLTHHRVRLIDSLAGIDDGLLDIANTRLHILDGGFGLDEGIFGGGQTVCGQRQDLIHGPSDTIYDLDPGNEKDDTQDHANRPND